MKTLTRGHFRAGLDSVRATKIRSFGTMLGIIIGVTSVITIVSIGQGIKQQITDQLHHIGGNIITVQPAQILTSKAASSNLNLVSGSGITAPLTSNDVNTVSTTPGVAASAPFSIATGSLQSETGTYSEDYVIGTTHQLPTLLNQSLAYGNFWDANNEYANVAVLGQTAAQKMFNVDVPLGHSFKFHGQIFIVQGIFNQFNSAPLGQQVNFNDAVFIPNAVAESLTNNTAPTYEILAEAKNSTQTAALAKLINDGLVKEHGGQGGFQVLSGDQTVAGTNNVLDLLTRLIAGIAAISLLVGGLGIMNVMLVSVSERLHEIGIRKAIGATNRQIMSQFLVESTVLSLSGGLIGIILAILIDIGLRAATYLTPDMSWQIVVISAGVAFLVGIIFGTIPAVKAARKDPILALRSE
jgi:putative ABC transport system permease protein